MADDGIDPRTGAVVPTMAEIAAKRERRTEPVMRIPAGWTYLGLYGGRSGRAKPHYRTAPGVIRTHTPGGREVHVIRCREFARFDRSRVPETPDFIVDKSTDRVVS